MVAVGREYARLVRETTSWWGAYPLEVPVAVGDCVQLKGDGTIVHVRSALDLPGWRDELPIDTTKITGDQAYFAGATKERSAFAGATGTYGGVAAGASITVSFSRVGGFVLEYTAGKLHRFRDSAKAKRFVLNAAMNDDWEEDWVLVTEVIWASSATALVSSGKSSRIVLGANANLPPDLAGVNLADAGLGLAAGNWEGGGYTSLCHPATPIYHCARARKRWWGIWDAQLQAAQDVDLGVAFVDSPFDDDV